MTNTPKSIPDLYRRWHAVFAFNQRPDESEEAFDARVDAADEERHALEHEIVATPATRPSDIALKLKAVIAFEGEFRYVGPTEGMLNSSIADLERLSERVKPTPELVALCERFHALVERYNSGGAPRGEGPDPAFDELQGVFGTIATFEARCAADVALKIRAEELNDDADYAALAEKGDSAGRALTRALADLDRLAREGGG